MKKQAFQPSMRGLVTSIGLLLFSVAAPAAYIAETEPNNQFETAQVISGGAFDLLFDANIGNAAGANTSTTIPHASIRGSGDGTFDWYTFTTSAFGVIIVDIDSAYPTTDIEIGLWRLADIYLLDINDDAPTSAGAGGSVETTGGISRDPFIQTGNFGPGQYFVGVCKYNCDFGTVFSMTGNVLASGDPYVLHISASGASVPEPGTLALLGLGLAGFAASRRPKQ